MTPRLVLTGLLLCGLAAGGPPPVRQAATTPKLGAPAGKITNVEGPKGAETIEIRNGQAVNQGATGDPLFVNDHILTGPDQSVEITLNDESEIVVGPSSEFTVIDPYTEENETTTLKLFYGMIHAAVSRIYDDDHPFVVETPVSVMGVRGTEFVVEQDKDSPEAAVHTLEGSVAMGSSREDLRSPATSSVVPAGMMNTQRRGVRAPNRPRAFNQQQLMQRLGRRSPRFVRHMNNHHQRHMKKIKGQRRRARRRRKPASAQQQQQQQQRRGGPQWARPKRRGGWGQ